MKIFSQCLNKFLLAVLWTTTCFILSDTVLAVELTEDSLKKDLSYYQKTAKTKSLGANDRLYILNRLREKYKDVEFDLTDLYAEIDAQSEARVKEPSKSKENKPPKRETVQRKIEAYAKLQRILVSENNRTSRIQLDVPGVKNYKDVLIRDDSQNQPPVLIFYLYHTREQLKPISKNFSIKKGPIKQIQTNLVEENPPTTKVSISLRDDFPYKITKTPKQILIAFDKTVAVQPETAKSSTSTFTSTATVTESSGTSMLTEEIPQTVSVIGSLPSEEDEEDEVEGLIRPGDILKVQVYPATLLSEHALVHSNGFAHLAFLGDFKVSNMTPSQAEDGIRKELARHLSKQNINVTFQKLNPSQVFIFGETKLPGIYNLNEPLTCSQLIGKSGGFKENADKKNVVIYRGLRKKKEKIVFDAERFYDSPNSLPDIPLTSGDIVEIPRTPQWILVMGAVQSPEWYLFKEGTKLTQSITLAGGFKKNAKTEQVKIVRDEQGKKISQVVNAKEILEKHPDHDPPLKNQDIIIVSEKEKTKSKFMGWRGTSWIIFIASLGLVVALSL